ncbi:hypothetical protein [Mycoplasma sp. E35C]|uniref:hypothetical protein n=1 Tax=Mycoplasma sp. E35C TaxID=2801918 RepID=UPI001CA4062B|nr:hypothetical protein [Mycoplasma sp. E35C]QZX49049.1 hypothetical protein JJE79_03255 [Mycoplasma sp. E35C]
MNKRKMLKKQLAIGLFVLPAVIFSSCSNVAPAFKGVDLSSSQNDVPTFSAASQDYKGVKIDKGQYYSVLSSSELIQNYENYTDPTNKNLYDNVVAKNIFQPEALKKGYVGFNQNVYSTKEQAQDSLYEENNALFYDGSLFRSKYDLERYIETKKELLSEQNKKVVILRNSNGSNFEPIDLDQLRKNSQTERLKLFNFITQNSKLQVQINKSNDDVQTIDVNSDNISSTISTIKSNVASKDIPVHYQKISANNNQGQYFIDTTEDDKYDFYGPLLYQGSADINAITNPNNWTKTSTLPVGLYRSISTDIATSAFDFLLGETNITNERDIKVLNRNLSKTDFIFYFPYNEKELQTNQYSTNLNLNLSWANFIYQLKTQQQSVYKNLLETTQKFNKSKRYSSFYKIPILYSYLIDALVANNAKEELIFGLKDFFIKLADKIDNALSVLNKYSKASGFDILANKDKNGLPFSFKYYFGIGNNDFDVSASLENLIPNLYQQFPNLTILMTILMLSNIVAVTPGAILDQESLIRTIKSFRLLGDKQIDEIFGSSVNNNWPAIQALWWLISSQNLTQALYVIGVSADDVTKGKLDEQTIKTILGLKDALSIKWIRNQFLQTSAINAIKEELPQVIRNVPTSRPKVRELFENIPTSVLEYLQGINVDFGTIIHIRNIYKKINQTLRTDPAKAQQYLSQVNAFLKSLKEDQYVDLYLTYMTQFPSVVKNNNNQNLRLQNHSSEFILQLHDKNVANSPENNTNNDAIASIISNSSTLSTSKRPGTPAILQDPKEINVNELKAIDQLKKDQKSLQSVLLINAIFEGFTSTLTSAVTINSLVVNPKLVNHTKDLVVAALQTVGSITSVVLSMGQQFANYVEKAAAVVNSVAPAFYGLTIAIQIAVLLINIFYPSEEVSYYVFKAGNAEYVWTGGYRKSWLLGLKTLEERTIKDIKLINPIQITRPQNKSFLYYNQKQFSQSEVENIRELQLKEWIENKNLYAIDQDYIKNVNKVYSLHNSVKNSSVSGVYSSRSLVDLYQNLLSTLLANSLITIPHTVATSIRGSYIQGDIKNAVVSDELAKSQNWTIVQLPNNETGGYLHQQSKDIRITDITSYDPETKIGIAKGTGKFGENPSEFIFYNSENKNTADHKALKQKFNELLKLRQTVYLDSVGSRTKLIYRSELFSLVDNKLGKTLYFLSLRDAYNYVDYHM